MNPPKNIAIVHDWLVSMRGGEKVLEVLCELFPDATLFTLVHDKRKCSPAIERMNIKTSFLQKLPSSTKKYQYYLPLFPTAIEQFDLSDFDLVISSSHAAAKGVRVNKRSLHICYCYTPMRYIWDQYEQYFGKGRASLITRVAMKFSLNYLRRWDVASSRRVDEFIGISNAIRERISRIYNRDAAVIFPPVDIDRYSISKQDGGYYLIVSALVPYKMVDLAVEAFNKLGERLIIIGTGNQEQRLRAIAKKNVEFLGWANDDTVKKYYEGCRALIFPGEEDFGIVPVEAMACGKPVIAFKKGGALDTMIDGVTGLFFNDPTSESLARCVGELSKRNFDQYKIREHSLQFERKIFKKAIGQFIETKWEEHIKKSNG
ncbi:MAG: glycosyltransferase [Ignavibacteriales bacterium]|nr:glycosyltransferase [Ignavibacteriales bacterium]